MIGDRPVFFKPLFDAQVKRIKQFLTEDNNFLSLDELTRKVNINIRPHRCLSHRMEEHIKTKQLARLLMTFRRPM